LLSIDKNGRKTEVPFIFYAVDPARYMAVFPNIALVKGSFFTDRSGNATKGGRFKRFSTGLLLRQNYNVDFSPGDRVTLLSLTTAGP